MATPSFVVSPYFDNTLATRATLAFPNGVPDTEELRPQYFQKLAASVKLQTLAKSVVPQDAWQAFGVASAKIDAVFQVADLLPDNKIIDALHDVYPALVSSLSRFARSSFLLTRFCS